MRFYETHEAEEHAFFAQLAALNAAFEAARAGQAASGFARRACEMDELLERFLAELEAGGEKLAG